MAEMERWKVLHQLYQAHPWHGIPIGESSPQELNVYVEIVPTDTVKYEIDKQSGILKIDRPQRYSNYCPTLYGFVPQTFCGKRVCDFTAQKANRKGLVGDRDPLDICVIEERPIKRGDVLIKAIPIGGMRMIDEGDEVDDKIIAVLKDDPGFGQLEDIEDCPEALLERLRHYFLTYKNLPGPEGERHVEILEIYNRKTAHEVITLAYEDYKEEYYDVWKFFGENCLGT